MIMSIINTIDYYANIINFICYLIIFLGGFYVAIHARVLPRWATTCIWYIGLSSFFVGSTIIVEWVFGQDHEFSYFMMGHAGEIVMNISITVMVFFLFFHTVYQDIKYKKKRKPPENMNKLSI